MKPIKDKVLPWLVPIVFWIYYWMVRLTTRIQVQGSEHADAAGTNGGFIYAFWHNRQIILPLIRPDQNIHCLISSSRDGQYIARIASWFGKKSVRGSTTRGGFEAMKSMMRIIRGGGIVAMTPDGPLGPRYKIKPGIVQMAQSLQCPVIPIAFDASRKKVFASWDEFHLPYPFCRISVVFGPAFLAAPDEPLEDACARLERALNETTQAAGALL